MGGNENILLTFIKYKYTILFTIYLHLIRTCTYMVDLYD